jgi:hypothetical protein
MALRVQFSTAAIGPVSLAARIDMCFSVGVKGGHDLPTGEYLKTQLNSFRTYNCA